MGDGLGISLTSFADRLVSLGWTVMASQPKTRGKLIQGFWATNTNDFRIPANSSETPTRAFLYSPLGHLFSSGAAAALDQSITCFLLASLYSNIPHDSLRPQGAFTHNHTYWCLIYRCFVVRSLSFGGRPITVIKLSGVRGIGCSDQLLCKRA